jgi:phosphoglycerate kinase
MNFITLDSFSVENKKVLIRVDFNVPMKDGKVVGLERILRAAPTIIELIEKGAKIIVLSHLGRPEGTGFEAEFSLKPIAQALSEVLKKPVAFASDCIGDVAKTAISKMQKGDVLMLENVRFYKAESKNDIEFTKKLAELGELYVSDAFSASHRAHSSTEGLAHLLPYAAGRLMEAELKALELALGNPQKPLGALVGGAKISTKLGVFHNLVKKANVLIVGGGMANTFLYSQGVDIGKSLAEKDMKDECIAIIKEAKANNCQIMLPVDARVSKEIKGTPVQIIQHGSLPEGFEVFDIGTQTIMNYSEAIRELKTLVWNGPVGAFEFEPFFTGTYELAKVAASQTKAGKLVTIAGGGDTVSALQNAGVYNDFTYISTAGGAFLEWMEGKVLPGVECLRKKK